MSQKYPYTNKEDDFLSQEDMYANSYQRQFNTYRPRVRAPSQEQPCATTSSNRTPFRLPGMALSFLHSCGLDSSDIAHLAELPEHLFTVEKLSTLLLQIKERKLSSASSSSSSSSRPGTSQPLNDTQIRTRDGNSHHKPVEYPINRSAHPVYPRPSEQMQTRQDRWGNPQRTSTLTSSSITQSSRFPDYSVSRNIDPYYSTTNSPSHSFHDVRPKPLLSLKLEPPVFTPTRKESSDFNCKVPPVYPHVCCLCDVTVRNTKEWFSHVQGTEHAKGQRLLEKKYPKWAGTIGSTRRNESPEVSKGFKVPTRTEASDFDGIVPPVFPYLCTLCNITVFSEKDWSAHITGGQHAKSQLDLMGKYPEWDGTVRSSRRNDGHTSTDVRDGTSKENTSNMKPSVKDKGRVICVKFATNSVEEKYLRKLLGQFGDVVQMEMLSRMAYVEMESNDQLEDIVKYFAANPLKVQEKHVEFSICEEFSFLQPSSRVVSFTPLPAGDGITAELTAIAKRFGSIKKSLFLPNRGYVEMCCLGEAKKLVEHYSSSQLKLKGKLIQVTFSCEYNSLRDAVNDETESRHSHTQRRSSPGGHSTQRDSASPRRRRSSEKTRTSPKRKHSSERTHSSPKRRRSSERPHLSGSHQIKDNEDKKEKRSRSNNFVVSLESDSDLEGCDVDYESRTTVQENFLSETMEITVHTVKTGKDSPNADISGSSNSLKEGPKIEEHKDHEIKEKDHDFPSVLENCVTLDEFTEENSSDCQESSEATALTLKVDLKIHPQKVESDVAVPPTELSSVASSAVSDKSQKPTEAESVKKPETIVDPLGPYEPNVPVGLEFMKMGYYCRVCLLFYSNEDTAKKVHCSSQAHYEKVKKHLEKKKAKAQSNPKKK